MAFQKPRCSTPVPGEKLHRLDKDNLYYDFCLGFLSQEFRDVPSLTMPSFGQESYRYDSYYALSFGEYTLSGEITEGRILDETVVHDENRSLSDDKMSPKPMRRFRGYSQPEGFSSTDSDTLKSVVVEPSSVGCFPLWALIRLLFSMIGKYYNKKNKKVVRSNRTFEL